MLFSASRLEAVSQIIIDTGTKVNHYIPLQFTPEKFNQKRFASHSIADRISGHSPQFALGKSKLLNMLMQNILAEIEEK